MMVVQQAMQGCIGTTAAGGTQAFVRAGVLQAEAACNKRFKKSSQYIIVKISCLIDFLRIIYALDFVQRNEIYY